MFDDIKVNSSGQTPNNLPVGEPDDIFAATEAPGIDQSSAVGAGKLQPKIQTMPEELSGVNEVKNSTFAKKMMIVAIVLVGVGILVGGSWLVYTMFVKSSNDVEELVLPENNTTTEQAPGAAEPVENNAAQNNNMQNAQTDDVILFGEQADSDSDNLTDSREKELGTNPNNWDTDGDGLSDGDEVLVWKSNPLNQDTDSDSYLDGAEVKNGYNPIGSGKIFDIPQP